MEFVSFNYGVESDEESNSYLFDATNDFNQPFIQEENEEDTEDYPYVTYQVPLSNKTNNKQAEVEALKLKAKLETRQGKINNSKEQKQRLDMQMDPSDLEVSFKKLYRLTDKAEEVRNCCYIAERDLLILTDWNRRAVKIYNTRNFKLIMTKKFKSQLNVVRYSADVDRIFFGGNDYYLEIVDPVTFCTEAKAETKHGYHIYDVCYLKKMRRIALGVNRGLNILDFKTLTKLNNFSLNGGRTSLTVLKSIIYLQHNFLLLLTSAQDSYSQFKELWVYDIKEDSIIGNYDADLCESEYIGVTGKHNYNIVSFLGKLPDESPMTEGGCRLLQMSVGYDQESFVVHKISPREIEFQHMSRIKNSDYYIMTTAEHTGFRTLLMKMTRDKAEIMNMAVNSDCDILEGRLFTMLKDSCMVVGVDKRGHLSVYKVSEHFVNRESK